MSNTPEHFEERIQEDKALSKLLIEKDIDPSADFSRGNYTAGFKEYISDRYFEAFRLIYHNNIQAENKEKLVPLLKSVPFLSTSEKKKKMVRIILPALMRAEEELDLFTEYIVDSKLLIQERGLFDKSLAPWVIAMINAFDDAEDVDEYKEGILMSCSEISYSLAQATPERQPVKHEIYSHLMSVLDQIERKGKHEILLQKFRKRKRNREKKAGAATYWIIFLLFMVTLIGGLIAIIGRLYY